MHLFQKGGTMKSAIALLSFFTLAALPPQLSRAGIRLAAVLNKALGRQVADKPR
jgi:hypothetical protein